MWQKNLILKICRVLKIRYNLSMQNKMFYFYIVLIGFLVLWSVTHEHHIATAITAMACVFGYFFYRNYTKLIKSPHKNSNISKSKGFNIFILVVLVLGVFSGYFYLIGFADSHWRDAIFNRFCALIFFIAIVSCIKVGKVFEPTISSHPRTIHLKDHPIQFWISIVIGTAIGTLLFLISEPANSILLDLIL